MSPLPLLEHRYLHLLPARHDGAIRVRSGAVGPTDHRFAGAGRLSECSAPALAVAYKKHFFPSRKRKDIQAGLFWLFSSDLKL